jgi:hypothetical protein
VSPWNRPPAGRARKEIRWRQWHRRDPVQPFRRDPVQHFRRDPVQPFRWDHVLHFRRTSTQKTTTQGHPTSASKWSCPVSPSSFHSCPRTDRSSPSCTMSSKSRWKERTLSLRYVTQNEMRMCFAGKVVGCRRSIREPRRSSLLGPSHAHCRLLTLFEYKYM